MAVIPGSDIQEASQLQPPPIQEVAAPEVVQEEKAVVPVEETVSASAQGEEKSPGETKMQSIGRESEEPDFDAMFAKFGGVPPTNESIEADRKQSKDNADAFVKEKKDRGDSVIKRVEMHGEFYDTARPVKPGDKESAPVPVDRSNFDGLKRAATSAALGAYKSVEDVSNGVKVVSNLAEDFLASRGIGDGKWIDDNKINFSGANDFPNTPADAITYSLARYLLPFGVAGKALTSLGLSGKASMVGSVATEATVAALAYDPDEQKLADMCSASPTYKNFVCDFLAADEDDTNIEKRYKAAGEAVLTLGMGAFAVESLVAVTKGVTGMVKNFRSAVIAEKTLAKAEEVMSSPKVAAALGKNTVEAKTALDKAAEEIGGVSAGAKVKESIPLTVQQEKTMHKMSVYREAPSLTDEVLANARAAKSSKGLIEAIEKQKSPIYMQLKQDFKRNVISLEEAEKKAIKILEDEKRITALLERDPGIAINGEEFVALSMLEEGAAKRVQGWLSKSMDQLENLDIAEKLAYFEDLATHTELSIKAAGGVSEGMRVGRYSQEIWKAATTSTKKMKIIEAWTKMAGKDLDNQIKYAKLATEQGFSIADISTGLAKVKGGGLEKASNTLYSLFVNGACSKVKTFLWTNMGSNMTNMYIHGPIVNAVESMLPGSPAHLKELETTYAGFKASFFEAGAAWKNVLKEGKVPASLEGKLTLPDPMFDADDAFGAFLGKYTNAVNATVELPSRMMSGGDAFSKIQVLRGHTNKYAYRLSQNTTDLSHADRVTLYNNARMNPPEAVEFAAMADARELTFTKRLDELTVVPRVIGQGLAKFGEIPLIGKVLTPFVGISSNMADAAIRHSPASLLTAEFREAWKAGGAAKSAAVAKVISGSGYFILGGLLSEADGIDEIYADQRGTAKAILGPDEQGIMTDAMIKVGSGHIAMSKLGIPGLMMMIGYDITRLAKHLSQEDDPKVMAIAINSALMLTTKFTPEALHGSLKDTVDILNDVAEGKSVEDKLTTSTAKMAMNLTPGRWVFSNTGDIIDPMKRDVSGELNSIREKIWNQMTEEMGFGKGKLPAITNIFGEPVNVPGGLTRGVISGFFGGESKDPRKEEVRTWLKKLTLDAPKLAGIMKEQAMQLHIGMPDRILSKTFAGVATKHKMTASEYRQLIRHINEPLGGKDLFDDLRDIKNMEGASDEFKKVQIKKIVSGRKSRAEQIMIYKTDGLQQRIEDNARARSNLLLEGQ